MFCILCRGLPILNLLAAVASVKEERIDEVQCGKDKDLSLSQRVSNFAQEIP